MKRSSPEVEKAIPRINARYFSSTLSAREQCLSGAMKSAMVELPEGWRVVGWAPSKEVGQPDLCEYVIMSQGPEGKYYWDYCSHHSLDQVAAILRRDPSKIAKL